MKPEMYIPQSVSRGSFTTSPVAQARIYTRGNIRLNRSAVDQIHGKLPSGQRFILYVYRDLGQIGIRAARADDPLVAVITGRPDGTSGALELHVKRLFLQFGINIDKAAALINLAYDEQNGLHVIPLPKGSVPRHVDSSVVRERLQAARNGATP